MIDNARNVVVVGERSGGVFMLKEANYTWHRCVGHRDPAVIDRLKKEDLDSGVKIVDCGTKFICQQCLEGKMGGLSFPQQSAKKTTQPLQFVHTDMWANVEHNSRWKQVPHVHHRRLQQVLATISIEKQVRGQILYYKLREHCGERVWQEIRNHSFGSWWQICQ